VEIPPIQPTLIALEERLRLRTAFLEGQNFVQPNNETVHDEFSQFAPSGIPEVAKVIA
jgi:hypothetical protein